MRQQKEWNLEEGRPVFTHDARKALQGLLYLSTETQSALKELSEYCDVSTITARFSRGNKRDAVLRHGKISHLVTRVLTGVCYVIVNEWAPR